jgi:hypothetical protein
MGESALSAGLVTVIGGGELALASVSPPSTPQPLSSGARTASAVEDARPRQLARANLVAVTRVAGKCRT